MKFFNAAFILFSSSVCAQVAIGTSTPSPGAMLDIVSTDKGVLLPRVASDSDVSSPVNGLMIYDESDNCINYYANGKWVNPCSGVAQKSCGSGYVPVEFKQVEVSFGEIGIAVSIDGDLYVTGPMPAKNVFGGLTQDQKLYDWVNYFDEPLSVTPPFASGTVVCADVTHYNSTSQIARVILGTSTGSIYTVVAPNANWVTGSYAGSTPVDVQAGNGYTVLDDAGDVWYSTDGVTFSQVTAIPESITGIKAEQSEHYNSMTTSNHHYAWSTSSSTLYVWDADPSSVTTLTFTGGNVVDVDHDYNRGALILLDNGAMYAFDGIVLGVSGSSSTTTSIPVVYTASNSRTLSSGEYFVDIETNNFDALAVTNLGNFYTYEYSTSGAGWYFEYEIGANDYQTVDITGSKGIGFLVTIDNALYFWGTSGNKSSSPYLGIGDDSGFSAYGASNGTINTNSPLSVNVCRQN